MTIPPYQPPTGPLQDGPTTLTCPKCRGTMRTYERNGIHLEQCDGCRGVFLDMGELEALTRLEAQMSQMTQYQSAPPPQAHGNYGPGWGNHHGKPYRKRGFGGLFFSS